MKTAIRLGQMAITAFIFLCLQPLGLGELSTRTVTSPPVSSHSATPAAQSWSMIISTNEDFGIFHSLGQGVTPDQTDRGIGHLFRRDLPNGPTRLLTRSSVDQKLANGSSIALALSGSGRYLLVLSDATNLTTNTVTGDNNLFRLDIATGLWQLVNHSLGGSSASGRVDMGQISSDGHFVLFTTLNRTLVASPPTGSTNGLYLADMETGAITLESGSAPNYDHVTDFALSPDGRNAAYVAGSYSPGFNTEPRLVLRNLQSHTSQRLAQGTLVQSNLKIPATSADGRYFFIAEAGRGSSNFIFHVSRGEFDTLQFNNSISLTAKTSINPLADGRMLSTPDGSRLFLADTNGVVYWDADTATDLVRVSNLATNGKPAKLWPCAVSSDGNKVLYGSPVDTTGTLQTNVHLYLTDIGGGQTTRITPESAEATRGEHFDNAVMDHSAKHIFFDSEQPGLHPDDLNESSDIFAFDVDQAVLTLLTPKTPDSPEPRAGGHSRMPVHSISGDGSYSIFFSIAPAVLEPFQATTLSLLGQNTLTGTREILSVDSTGSPVTQSPVLDAVLSGNGKFVLILTAATNMASQTVIGGRSQLILRDIANQTNHLASADQAFLSGTDTLFQYAIGADGQRVVYSTKKDSTPMMYDLQKDQVFAAVQNLQGSTQAVTIKAWGLNPNGDALAFLSASTNLALDAPNDGFVHMYLRNLTAGTNRWLPSFVDDLSLSATTPQYSYTPTFSDNSTALTMQAANGVNQAAVDASTGQFITQIVGANELVVSPDHQYAAYRLRQTPTGAAPFARLEIWLTHIPSGETRLVTHSFGKPTSPSSGSSSIPRFSPDGAFLVFSSTAPDLIGTNMSPFAQAYLYNVFTDELILASTSTSGNGGANEASSFVIAASGSPKIFFASGATDLRSQGQPSGLLDLFQTEFPENINALRDSDNDGLPDWWEKRYFGTLARQGSETGLSGLRIQQEYEQSVGILTHLWINPIYNPSAGELQITFPSVVGKNYRLESTSDLSNPGWPTTTSSVTATEATTTFSQTPQTDPTFTGAIYFRVVQLP